MRMQKCTVCLLIAGFLALIFDARTAYDGATAGIQLCLYTIVPALFPFMFLSSVLVNTCSIQDKHFLRKIGNALKLPPGSEPILLAGFLGGYPTGAACIGDNYRAGRIQKDQAEYLLSFCNNAGPSFIFGIAGSMFSFSAAVALWVIHISAAILTALLLPSPNSSPIHIARSGVVSYSEILQRTIRTMGSVCGWVVLFRILIHFLRKWFLWLFPSPLRILLTGMLELSNGCCELGNISSLPVRFLLFSFFLALGGVCVAMQTASAANPLSLRLYFAGKAIQSVLSIQIGLIVLPFLFGFHSIPNKVFLLSIPLMAAAWITVHKCRKITVDFPVRMRYNSQNS